MGASEDDATAAVIAVAFAANALRCAADDLVIATRALDHAGYDGPDFLAVAVRLADLAHDLWPLRPQEDA